VTTYADHQELLQRAFLAFQQEFPLGRVFPRHVGLFKTQRDTRIQIGMKGQADAWGWVPVHGMHPLHFEVECKTGNAVQMKDQKLWESCYKSAGGLYILLREENDLLNEIKKMLVELGRGRSMTNERG